MTVEHRDQHGDTAGVHAIDRTSRCGQHRRGDQSLYFDRQTAMPIQCERHTGAFHGCRVGRIRAVSRQEQSGGIGDLFDALTAHVETADFIGRTKTILHRSQHSQRGLAVAFELADHIDQMLQCARACNRTILGHMTNQKYWNVKCLSGIYQRACHFAHLSRTAGNAIDLLRDDGLRRIHNGQGRLVLFDQPQYCGQVGGGGQ